ncbi:hypothetical protein C3L33_12337, partial [Rhododendron williamsianum]
MHGLYLFQGAAVRNLEFTCSRWNSDTHSFAWAWGESGLSLEDVHILTRLSLRGGNTLDFAKLSRADQDEVGALKAFHKHAQNGPIFTLQGVRKDFAANAKKTSLGSWLRYFFKDLQPARTVAPGAERDFVEGPEYGQHFYKAGFFSYFLSYFVLPDYPGDGLSQAVFPLAVFLARGQPVALAPLFLGSLFRQLDLVQADYARSLGRQLGFDQGVPGPAPAMPSFAESQLRFMAGELSPILAHLGDLPIPDRDRVSSYTREFRAFWRRNLDSFQTFVRGQAVVPDIVTIRTRDTSLRAITVARAADWRGPRGQWAVIHAEPVNRVFPEEAAPPPPQAAPGRTRARGSRVRTQSLPLPPAGPSQPSSSQAPAAVERRRPKRIRNVSVFHHVQSFLCNTLSFVLWDLFPLSCLFLSSSSGSETLAPSWPMSQRQPR